MTIKITDLNNIQIWEVYLLNLEVDFRNGSLDDKLSEKMVEVNTGLHCVF